MRPVENRDLAADSRKSREKGITTNSAYLAVKFRHAQAEGIGARVKRSSTRLTQVGTLTMVETYRQGDVLLAKVPSLPKHALRKPVDQRIVLAWGETTGHAHAIDARYAKLYQHGAERFIEVLDGAVLVHEEHSPITLKPGIYRVVQQREYVPGSTRLVVD